MLDPKSVAKVKALLLLLKRFLALNSKGTVTENVF